MSVFILGPTKWQRNHDPQIPAWLRSELPPTWAPKGRDVLSPLDIRAGMAAHLTRYKHDAMLMENFEKQEGETNTALFRRIASQATQHFVYWPHGAQRPGVDWELEILANWLEEQRELDVRIFVESKAGRIVNGHFESREEGHRTTYYEDLVALGCPIIEWENYESLWSALRHHTER